MVLYLCSFSSPKAQLPQSTCRWLQVDPQWPVRAPPSHPCCASACLAAVPPLFQGFLTQWDLQGWRRGRAVYYFLKIFSTSSFLVQRNGKCLRNMRQKWYISINSFLWRSYGEMKSVWDVFPTLPPSDPYHYRNENLKMRPIRLCLRCQPEFSTRVS